MITLVSIPCHVLPHPKPIPGSPLVRIRPGSPQPICSVCPPALPCNPPHLRGETFPRLCLVYTIPSAWDTPVFSPSGQIYPLPLVQMSPSSTGRRKGCFSSGPHGAQVPQIPLLWLWGLGLLRISVFLEGGSCQFILVPALAHVEQTQVWA